MKTKLKTIRNSVASLLCVFVGHRLSLYDSDILGPVVVCDRCLDTFEYDPDLHDVTPDPE